MNEDSPNGLTYVPARYTYDAAGHHTLTTQTTSRQSTLPHSTVIFTTAVTATDTYDGDGQGIKRVKTSQVNSNSPTTETIYYLRSSVLGGRIVTEYDSQGARQTSYAYAGAEPLAVQEGVDTTTPTLSLRHTNPVTGDGRKIDPSGRVTAETHVDTEGVDVGNADPFAGEAGEVGGTGEGMSQGADKRDGGVADAWLGREAV